MNQASLFSYNVESDWRPPDMSTLPSLKGAKLIALDTETKDPLLKERGMGCWRKDGHIVGASIAIDGGPKFYLPTKHGGGDNLDPEQVRRYLSDNLTHFDGTVVGAKILYDLAWLREDLNVHLKSAKFVDIQWADAILDEFQDSYSLANIAKRRGLKPKDETLLNEAALMYGVDPKSGLWQMAARFVGPYAEGDAERPLEIWRQQQKELDDQGLNDVMNLEHGNIPLLLEMQCRGVRVDVERAGRLLPQFQDKEKEILLKMQQEFGMEPELWSAASCASLFDHLGLEYPRTAFGEPSFTAPWLDEMAKLGRHPVYKMLLEARQYNKGWSNAIEGMIFNHEVKGRLHPELHPLRSEEGDHGTVGGRFAMSNPSLHQVPTRNENVGPEVRACYLPEEGQHWGVGDYSQQEPRLTIHYAELLDLPGARRAGDQFRANPATDYHQLVADITGLPRPEAKIINLGVAYGMGGAKLCRKLGLPTIMAEGKGSWKGRTFEQAGPEGAEIINQYHSNLPYVKKLGRRCEDRVHELGYITTLGGRRCRFNMWESATKKGSILPHDEALARYGHPIRRAKAYKAMNRLIQGSGADMIKFAMRDMYAAGYVPLVTVHDELGVSIEDPEEINKIEEIMRDCVKLTIPMKVDLGVGANWGEAK